VPHTNERGGSGREEGPRRLAKRREGEKSALIYSLIGSMDTERTAIPGLMERILIQSPMG